MYVRRDRKRLADGSRRTYLSLAHNVWEPVGDSGKKRARPIVFAHLGVEEDVDLGAARGMRDALDRYIRRRMAEEAASASVEDAEKADPAEAVRSAAERLRPRLRPLRILTSREYGLRVIVERAWKDLGLEDALQGLAAQHDLEFDLERIVFGMVFNRLVDPMSKRACNEWLRDEAFFPEAEGWQVQHFYRALDVLHDHADELDRTVMRQVWKRLPAENRRLLLLDTTSTYFESDQDDVERAEVMAAWQAYELGEGPEPNAPVPQVVNDPPMRMRGHSKDKRPDLPQVVVGHVSTTDGRWLRHKTYPGNTNDQKVTVDLVREITELADDDTRVVVVCDSGMGGAPNLRQLDALDDPPHWLVAVSIRKSKFGRDKVLAAPGRMHQVPGKPSFKVREVTFSADESPSGRPERWVVSLNLRQAERQRARLAKHIKRVEAVLASDDRAKGHGKPVCDMLAKPHLKRLVRTSTDGRRLLLDRSAIKRERERAGMRLYRSTLADVPAADIFVGYQALLGVERDFRTYKGPLKLRPMHHRADRRIAAHVTICALALLVLRELERRTELPFERLRKIFGGVRAALVEQDGLRFWQRGEWTDDAGDVLELLDIGQGPRTWDTQRVRDDGREGGTE